MDMQEYADSWFAVLKAAIVGDEAQLDELVSKGVDLDMQLELELGSASVLHVLAIRGILPATELLIKKGATIDMVSGEGSITALHFAAMCGHADLLQRLIELGANVHATSSGKPHAGKSNIPLQFVTYLGRDGQSSVQILRHLLQHAGGASDIFIVDADGDTALHCAAFNKTIPDIMIKELLSVLSTSFSSIVNKKNHKGQTPLHYAVCNSHPEASNLLLKAGASKDACDAYGATPFHYAARYGNVHALDMLNDVELNIVDAPAIKNHFRALHYAAWNKRHEAVEWLLQHI